MKRTEIKPLSSPIFELKSSYDVVIVGSGYGGAIAASRLARARDANGARLSIALLERGHEIRVGDFPSEFNSSREQIGLQTPKGDLGKSNGLYQFHVGEQITVLHGCGLGGTSLINANVSVEPDARVYDDPRWPEPIRGDHGPGSELADGFERARSMLVPSEYPDNDYPRMAKYDGLVESAAKTGAGANAHHVPVNINWKAGRNAVGIDQPQCTGCGDCVGGCNVGAKNTLMMNYLPDAKAHGAEIFCGLSVQRVQRHNGRWYVYYQPVGFGRDKFEQGYELFVTASTVVLAAGTIGSTEIMLRSKAAGLHCSDAVGKGFSGNGDVLGFSYNNDGVMNSIGRGLHATRKNAPGPTITGVIDLRSGPLEEGIFIEDGVLPGSMRKILPVAFAAAGELIGKDTDSGVWDKIKETLRAWSSVLFGAYHGAIKNTGVYLVMSHEQTAGTFKLDGQKLVLDWKGIGDSPHFARIAEKLEALTAVHGGTYVPSPIFTKPFGHELITVHPLGGCVMASSSETGVVDHRGRVFRNESGAEVYDGLIVSDGSIVPRPLGVNPLLTISALSERCIALLAADRGWTIDYKLDGAAASLNGTRPPGKNRLQFTERLSGYCSTSVFDDFDAAEKQGREAASECAGVFTILSPDLDAMIEDPDQQAKLTGSVWLPALSTESLTVFDGIFNLLVTNPTDARKKRMRYRAKLASVEGRTYYLEGTKFVEDDKGFDVLIDTTTLYVTIFEGVDSTGPVRAKGIIRISPSDFARQVETVAAVDKNGHSSLENKLRFAKLFGRGLWKVYVGN